MVSAAICRVPGSAAPSFSGCAAGMALAATDGVTAAAAPTRPAPLRKLRRLARGRRPCLEISSSHTVSRICVASRVCVSSRSARLALPSGIRRLYRSGVIDESAIRRRFAALAPVLDERGRRGLRRGAGADLRVPAPGLAQSRDDRLARLRPAQVNRHGVRRRPSCPAPRAYSFQSGAARPTYTARKFSNTKLAPVPGETEPAARLFPQKSLSRKR